jgi:HEPN domain-containing protein
MQSVRRVARYYLSTRYPNRQPLNVVPAEAFNKNEAEMAVDAASKVLELVDEYCLEE